MATKIPVRHPVSVAIRRAIRKSNQYGRPAVLVLPPLEGFVAIGASIMARAFRQDLTGPDFYNEARSQGFDLGHWVYSESGISIDGYAQYATATINAHAGAPNIIALIHGPGNNVTNNGEWSTWTQVQKDEVTDGLIAIINQFKAAGIEPVLSNLTYRLYADTERSGLVNENLIHPIIQQHCPDWWDSAKGRPVLDLWTLSYNNRDIWFDDAVHPNNEVGFPLMHQYLVQQMASVRTLPKAYADTFNLTAAFADPPFNSNTICYPGTSGSVSDLVDMDGNVVSGSTCVWAGLTAASGQFNGISSKKLYHDCRGWRTTAHSARIGDSATIVTTLGAGYANRTGTLKVVGARSFAGTYMSQFTVGANSVQTDPNDNPAVIAELPVTLGANGEFTLTITDVAGNAYFSGMTLYLDTV